MASPQKENGFIGIANELYEEILRRDFSKRQQNVLLMILRLSYGCRRKNCEIPKFNFFELAGLYKGDIKKELKYLKTCRVIDWEEENMIFSINKNYEIWQLSPAKNFDREKLNELVSINLKGAKVSKTLTNEVSETLTNTPINEEELVSKILTKIEGLVSETLTTKLVKHELLKSSSPTESKGEEVPKDSIKDNIKNNNKKTTPSTDDLQNEFNQFWDIYKKKADKKKAFEKFKLKRKKFSLEQILNGTKAYMTECERKGTEKQYIKGPAVFLNGENFNDEYEEGPKVNIRAKQYEEENFLERLERMKREAAEQGE